MLLRPQKAPSIRRLRPFLCIFSERSACRPWNVRPSTLRIRFLLSSLEHTQSAALTNMSQENISHIQCCHILVFIIITKIGGYFGIIITAAAWNLCVNIVIFTTRHTKCKCQLINFHDDSQMCLLLFFHFCCGCKFCVTIRDCFFQTIPLHFTHCRKQIKSPKMSFTIPIKLAISTHELKGY